ncbi:MAG: DegV family protein [Bacillota bacterium]
MKIKLMTDSASDLPREITQKYDIAVVPFSLRKQDKEFVEGEDITSTEVLKGMRKGEVYKTVQVPPNTFYEAFNKFAEDYDCCIYIGFSSRLSGTFQTSVMIKNQINKEYSDYEIEVIDSRCASLGQGLVVLKTAEYLKNNSEKAQIKEKLIKKIKYEAEHMEHIFTVDDLEYLSRGGRISKSKAFVGGLLNIKPILQVKDGELIPLSKARGRKKVLNRMIKTARRRGVDLSRQLIGISHGDDKEGAQILKNMMEDNFDCQEFLINTLGATIGAHAGPGTLAVYFSSNPRI